MVKGLQIGAALGGLQSRAKGLQIREVFGITKWEEGLQFEAGITKWGRARTEFSVGFRKIY